MRSTLLTRSRNSRSNKSVLSFTSTNTYSKISGSLADSITRIYASFAFSIRTFYSNRFFNTPRILSDNSSTSFLVVSKPFFSTGILFINSRPRIQACDDRWFVILIRSFSSGTKGSNKHSLRTSIPKICNFPAALLMFEVELNFSNLLPSLYTLYSISFNINYYCFISASFIHIRDHPIYLLFIYFIIIHTLKLAQTYLKLSCLC